jgi:hypothetical protein
MTRTERHVLRQIIGNGVGAERRAKPRTGQLATEIRGRGHEADGVERVRMQGSRNRFDVARQSERLTGNRSERVTQSIGGEWDNSAIALTM